jgi:tetratricopeptide (TPR) repeat protein
MIDEAEIETLIKQAIDASYKKLTEEQYEAVCVITKQVLKICPENTHALHMLGVALHALGQFKDALQIIEKLHQLEPKNYENINNMALTLSSLNQHEKSVELLMQAIEAKGDSPSLYNNLALSYRSLGQHENAIHVLLKSLDFAQEPKTYGLLGACHGEMQNLEQAKEFFMKALELDPEYYPARVDLAAVYHLIGDYDAGFREYEHRFKVYEQLSLWMRIYKPEKRWQGENLDGKTIIVHTEQGLGDNIHFVRYVPLLRQWNVKIIIHCSESLRELFSPFADEIYTEDPKKIEQNPEEFKPPEHDCACSVVSLLHLLDNPPIPSCPYIHVKNAVDMSAYEGLFKIGIVWGGNPQHPNDRKRSCHLKMFRDIQNLPKVKLFSLMKDTRFRCYNDEDSPIDLTVGTEDMKIVDMSEKMNSFADTARILNSLDLVIGVDTSVIHLAGAMGVRTFCALAWNPDWRWKLQGKNTEWYESVCLFRQTIKDDWLHVFQDILAEVKKQIGCAN